MLLAVSLEHPGDAALRGQRQREGQLGGAGSVDAAGVEQRRPVGDEGDGVLVARRQQLEGAQPRQLGETLEAVRGQGVGRDDELHLVGPRARTREVPRDHLDAGHGAHAVDPVLVGKGHEGHALTVCRAAPGSLTRPRRRTGR